MNDDGITQLWMYASGCTTHSIAISNQGNIQANITPKICSGTTIMFQFKEPEPEMLIEFDYDRYGHNINSKLNTIWYPHGVGGRALVNRYIRDVDSTLELINRYVFGVDPVDP
mgnify:CR=1 FL=1